MRQWTSGFHKTRGISWLTEKPLICSRMTLLHGVGGLLVKGDLYTEDFRWEASSYEISDFLGRDALNWPTPKFWNKRPFASSSEMKQCHVSTAHSRSPHATPRKPTRDLWTKLYWDMFVTGYFGFALSVPFQQCSITTHISFTRHTISNSRLHAQITAKGQSTSFNFMVEDGSSYLSTKRHGVMWELTLPLRLSWGHRSSGMWQRVGPIV